MTYKVSRSQDSGDKISETFKDQELEALHDVHI